MKRFLLLLLAPGLGCAAAETPVVRVVPELTTERHIHTGPFHLGELERDRYFRSYHPPGLFSEERNQELQEIGAMPGRGSYRIDLPLPPDDPEEIARTMGEGRVTSSHHPEPYEAIYRRIPPDTRAPHAIAHGRYPVWMREGVDLGQLQDSAVEDWEAIGLGNVLRRDLYPSVADGVVRLFSRWKGLGVDYPRYYTVQNEPIWQWQTGDLADFHNEVARRMRQAHPEVLVGGPCYAWPYPQGDWRGWRNPSRFIELSGGDLGFYDLHFYSKGDWALPLEPRWQEQRVDHPSLYRSQRLGVGTVWDFGRLEGYLDLWNAHHLATWNGEWKPMVISEFGRQGIFPQFGPWTNDFKPFIFMSTIVRMWMTFMERPDIQLTVPFILGESDLDYAPRRGMAIYTRPRAELSRQFVELAQRLGQGLLDDPDSPPDPGLEPTRFHDFYRFFSDIRGHRIPVEIASADPAAARRLLVLGFREGETAYLWIHNGGAYPEDPVTVDLEELFRQWGRGVRNIEHKRLYFAGPVPDPHAPGEIAGLLHIDAPDAYRPLPGGRLELSGEETVVVRIRLDAELAVRGQLHEHQFFASETTVPFAGGRSAALTFSLDAADLDDLSGAVAHLGLARDGGFPARARVSINGTVAGIIDLGHSAGVTHFHAVERLRIPAGLLRAGRNRVEVDLSDTLAEGDPRLVSGRLTLLRESIP
jgi:hypothetical protein